MKIQSVRGMNDVLPADSAAWQYVHAVASQVFAAYGYGELRLPVVERTELFKRAVGEVTDVVEKEMYSFEDRGGEALSLRPELTAGVVRAGIEHGILFNQQQRVWCTGPVFRYERPQAGRYRQFHQLDVEAFGIATPDVDVEVIAIAAQLWKRLGLTGFELQINTLGTPGCRANHRAALIAYLEQHEAGLDEDAKRRLHSNPLRVLDSKVPATQAIVEGAPRLLDYLDKEGLADNTVVILSSDQGFFMGEHGWFDKRWIFEESLRTPFLVRWPGVSKPGSTSGKIVSLLDLAQTFLDLAGQPQPSDMQGRSLVPLFKGEDPADWRKSFYYHYYEFPVPHRVRPHYGVITDRYKLVHYYKPDVDDRDLLDRQKDPLETKNFYADPAYADTVKELKAELIRLQTEVKETLPPPRAAHGNAPFEGEPALPKKGKGKGKKKEE